MLDKWKKERETAKLADWMTAVMSADPVWAVLACKTQWICPLCGQVAADVPSRAELPAKALAHLRKKCGPFSSGVREPQFSKDQLDAKIRFLEVKALVLSSLLWQQRDSRGRWYCPYCVREGEVQIPLDGRINLELIERMNRHIESCFAYDHGRGQAKPAYRLRTRGTLQV
jgi:hypothetical protein